jgi:hypothetical protein
VIRSEKHAGAAELGEDAPTTTRIATMLAKVGLTTLILARPALLDNAVPLSTRWMRLSTLY